MYTFFIGCDISKNFFDVSYYDGKPIYLGQFGNSVAGFKQMVKQLKKVTNHPKSTWFCCFENTGVYSKAILEWLISQQISCREENPLKIYRSKGMQRGKNDKTDSKTICRYVFEKRDSIEPTQLPDPVIVKLKKLLSRRDFIVRQKQSQMVSLKDQKMVLDPKHYELFQSQNKEVIAIFAEQIEQIEEEIVKTVEEDPEVKQNYDLAESVCGIGLITATYMIATTNNFKSFSNGRKYSSYCGVAPFLHFQTGIKKGKMKISQMGNKKMKSLLSNGVNAAVRFDPELKQYYERKLAEGKEKGVVINNVKNKLVQRVFSVVKRKTPYVKLMTYA